MNRTSVQSILFRLKVLGDPQRARNLQWFFKTGPGEYGQGDVFAGLKVPEVRRLAKEYRSLPLSDLVQLLRSPIHEARFLALLLLVRAFQQGDGQLQKKIYRTYLLNTRFINNWDLVDLSAEHIVGAYLDTRGDEPLQALASSNLIWERRIAIMSTFYFIKRGLFGTALFIARRLLQDQEDLIHKAAGWMLREIGKRDQAVAEGFLRVHYQTMPRTMLRYAIEKFPEDLRQRYLKGKI